MSDTFPVDISELRLAWEHNRLEERPPRIFRVTALRSDPGREENTYRVTTYFASELDAERERKRQIELGGKRVVVTEYRK